jgi:hypothetical protein
LDSAASLVDVEEISDMLPDGLGRRIVLHDHIHEVVGEGGMNPHEDSEIGLQPGGVVRARIVGFDVAEEIKTAEYDAEGIPPAPEGGRLYV